MTGRRPSVPRVGDVTPEERRAERIVLLAFATSALTGVALLVVYALGGNTQVEGLLLVLCLGGIGVGIVIWAQRLMATKVHVEPRGHVATSPEEMAEFEDAMTEEAGFSRRTLLIGALAGALGGLAAALAIPVLSLGPAPGNSLFVTSWKAGRRLAPAGGQAAEAVGIPVGGILTVFPDGDDSDPNAATVLIRTEPGRLQLPADRAAWAPNGFVAYSKLCTHAGCPVGLYRSTQHTLICPCHQSEFDVLNGAVPINGPAARPLPQLPIQQAADGSFVALGDFSAPVGPSFWDITR
ncbi:MAG: Rieske 2Fe-2S domain-containing protein [Chloroflexota bacterium]